MEFFVGGHEALGTCIEQLNFIANFERNDKKEIIIKWRKKKQIMKEL